MVTMAAHGRPTSAHLHLPGYAGRILLGLLFAPASSVSRTEARSSRSSVLRKACRWCTAYRTPAGQAERPCLGRPSGRPPLWPRGPAQEAALAHGPKGVAGPKDKKRRERKREGKKKKKKRGHVGRIPSRAEPDENEMGCTLVILACELFSFFSDFFPKKFISRPYELGIR